MAPKIESLGKNLPKKGFIYDRSKYVFSDRKSGGKVVLAIQAAAHATRIHPSAVDHHIAMFFSFAADMAHTIRSHGDNFWRVVMKQVAWARDNKTITPIIVKELTRYVMEARLRCRAHTPDLPFHELNITAIAVDRFFANLEEAGMDRYIPVLEAEADGAEQTIQPTEPQQPEKTEGSNEDTPDQATKINQATETNVPEAVPKRKVTFGESDGKEDDDDLPRAKKQQLTADGTFVVTSYGEKGNKTHFKGQKRIDADLQRLALRFRALGLSGRRYSFNRFCP
ncbi:hypothetical protein CONLIGDRAFT_638657 [Coniochaeta ligniaria NRRL 30616]|uniref:Uncharacterized protein n=1 Tax=Coniochaeta ligniaria NRRL 30616 TaxID=1408157 RepID=A0A1J7J4I3_9PEZI|nr:hypothetical protein CONLIGDRAFT_638657 [Coniochaeta ligniaria NRRL 30616]